MREATLRCRQYEQARPLSHDFDVYLRHLHDCLDSSVLEATLRLMLCEREVAAERQRRLIGLRKLANADVDALIDSLGEMEREKSRLVSEITTVNARQPSFND